MTLDGVHSPARQTRLYVLGPFRLEPGGADSRSRSPRPARLGTRKIESLLAFLALHPGAHTRGQLAAHIWGDVSERQARGSLRTALAALRGKISPHLLLVDRESVELNPEFPLWVDALEFQTQAQAFLAAPSDNLGAIDLALYRGDLLPDFYDEWISPEREQLAALHTSALLGLAQAARSQSDYARAIQFAQQVISGDPANERAHQHLMLAYLAMGDLTAALAQYESCCRALRLELDVEPTAETTALYEWIKRSPSPERPLAAAVTNLPLPVSSFIGRRRETTELKRLLADTEAAGHRLVTLTGAGGSGKTRLAVQVATDLVDAFKDGVWWVELSSVADPWVVPQAIARALGVREAGSQPIAETLEQAIAARQLLLLLDNCEHLVLACAEIAERLLQACPNLRIFATSREGLGLAGELNWLVPLFSVPDPLAGLPVLKENDAIRLFAARAAAVRTDFALTEANAPAVAQICRRLDGIPLAIELAAAQVPVLAVEEIAARLDNRFNLLTTGSRTVLPRQQTLRATLDWSYDLLSTEEGILFRRLGAFVGGRTASAAEAVCAGEGVEQDQVLDLLARLVSQSLLYAEEKNGETRYRFLETVRHYAREKLARSGEVDWIQKRHRDHFLQRAEEAAVEMLGPAQGTWLNRLEAEHENLRAALQYSADTNAVESGMRLATALGRFWEVRGYAAEGVRWLNEFLSSPIPVPAALRARALYRLGYLQFHQSDYANARVAYEASLALQQQIGDKLGAAQTLGSLAGLAWAKQDYAEARRQLEESLVIRRELGSQVGIASALNNLGVVAACAHDYAAARAYFFESIAVSKESGNQWGIADALQNVGELETLQGEHAQALDHLRQGLEIYRTLQAKPGVVRTVESIAVLALLQGQARRAAHLLGAAQTLRQAIHLPVMPSAREEHEGYVTRVRAALGPAAFDQAWAEGCALATEQLIEMALDH